MCPGGVFFSPRDERTNDLMKTWIRERFTGVKVIWLISWKPGPFLSWLLAGHKTMRPRVRLCPCPHALSEPAGPSLSLSEWWSSLLRLCRWYMPMRACGSQRAEVVWEIMWCSMGCRYVCDYTYYLSLHHGNGHAALIHVPPLSHWFPASLLGKALQAIIREMLGASGKVQAQSQGCREPNSPAST